MPQQRRIWTAPGCQTRGSCKMSKMRDEDEEGGKMKEQPCEQGLSVTPRGMGMCCDVLPTWHGWCCPQDVTPSHGPRLSEGPSMCRTSHTGTACKSCRMPGGTSRLRGGKAADFLFIKLKIKMCFLSLSLTWSGWKGEHPFLFTGVSDSAALQRFFLKGKCSGVTKLCHCVFLLCPKWGADQKLCEASGASPWNEFCRVQTHLWERTTMNQYFQPQNNY